ncbi:MAG: sugar ABC transporter ATP-binding protein [bacterium]|nr:sugar ABC transporter ATP-binding protein [bacterium]
MQTDFLVRMENISVEFPGVKALDDVHFSLKKGEVHVLLGENGAGKSTLMKVLSGVNRTTSGKVFIDEKEVKLVDTRHSLDEGISIIYQELNLIPHLTVAENIFLGKEPKKYGIIDWKKMFRGAQLLLEELHVDISPRAVTKKLGIAQQQMVEVAKALSEHSNVIIMDEPTSALTEKEIHELFRTIHELKSKGVGIVYISHRLEEIPRIGDRVTVLRDGKYIETLNVKDTTLEELISLMVGRELKEKFPKEIFPMGKEILQVKNISTKEKLNKCSFTLKKGEILGLAGLMGAGRTELARAIYGADRIESGEICLDGSLVHVKTPKHAVEYHIGLLPEDRKAHGLVLGLSVRENITLANIEKILQGNVINYRKEREESQTIVENLAIKTPNLKQKVKFLSGGNQQKVVVGKWLMTDSSVLIFDEPTRGIDVGAKVEIYKIMTELAKKGIGIIMISSELPEILGMSDRILVMHGGKIMAELPREEATQEKILYYATGGEKTHEQSERVG